MIREAFDATNDVASALGVYDALTEIASDLQSETFQTTHAWIQRISGQSVATIKRRLAAFADLGIVRIDTPALRAPSTYHLLSLANHEPTLANDELALAHSPFRAPRATSEESQKKLEKKERTTLPAPAGRERNPIFDALAAATDGPADQLTAPTARAVGVALAVIRKVSPDLTCAEIERRASNYKSHFENAAMTASALSKHWARCDTAAEPRDRGRRMSWAEGDPPLMR